VSVSLMLWVSVSVCGHVLSVFFFHGVCIHVCVCVCVCVCVFAYAYDYNRTCFSFHHEDWNSDLGAFSLGVYLTSSLSIVLSVFHQTSLKYTFSYQGTTGLDVFSSRPMN